MFNGILTHGQIPAPGSQTARAETKKTTAHVGTERHSNVADQARWITSRRKEVVLLEMFPIGDN